MSQTVKIYSMLFLVVASLIATILIIAPFAQDQHYHQFVDGRSIFGIPNFHNVMTNIVFIYLGLKGLRLYRKNPNDYTSSWIVFFISIFCIGLGSAYYHYAPTDKTLVWDRLPMTLGFTSLLSGIFVDLFNIRLKHLLLIALNLIGIYSLCHWVFFNDLRIYMWVQLITIFLLLYVVVLFQTKDLRRDHIFYAFLFYVLAKVCEHNDSILFQNIQYSGHAIKHLLAGVAIYYLVTIKKVYPN